LYIEYKGIEEEVIEMKKALLGNRDLYFFLACLCLGIAFQQMIENYFGGVSIFLFLATFYTVFILRFRNRPLANMRLGTLLMICTWVLTSTFFLNNSLLFWMLNILIIPFLIVVQLVLITGKPKTIWYHWSFLAIILKTIGKSIGFTKQLFSKNIRKFKKGVNEQSYHVVKKIFIGLLITAPIMFMVLILLSSADLEFRKIIINFPGKVFNFEIGDEVIRLIVILFFTFTIFSFLQVLYYKSVSIDQEIGVRRYFAWDPIIIWTLLISLNLVYLLFTIVQFRYLFNNQLETGFTYAEYARRGFFELLVVILLNLSILVIVLSLMKHQQQWKQRMTRGLLSTLVAFTGVMLISAFLRLMMYEEAYGFTFSRVVAHSFMLYVMILLVYTFLKIWLDRLSLIHFFLLSGLIYYSLLNVINIDQMVVNENLERYEKTGKVDIHYLNSLGYTGISGLIELYEENPNIPQLQQLLRERKQVAVKDESGWWEWNWSREKAYKKLKETEF
jgi:hypothetical protein